MKRGKPKHSEVEQQGRPVGRQFTATSIAERFSSRKRMVQAVDLNHEEGQRRLARGSTPASEAAKWRRAAPASSRHQDSEGTLGQTQTAICSRSRRYTREAGRASMSSACTASVACAKANVGATMHLHIRLRRQRGGRSGRGAPKSTPSGQPADHPEPRSMAEEAHHKGLGKEPI